MIPKTIEGREYTKFTLDSEGNTAVRVVIGDEPIAPTNITLSTQVVTTGKAQGEDVAIMETIGGNSTSYTYTITGGADGDKFQINGDILEVGDYTIDIADVSYELELTTTGNSGETYTRVFTITVTNDSVPTDIILSTNQVPTGSSAGYLVAAISGVDGTPTYTFSEVSDPDNKFFIEDSNLKLSDSVDINLITSHPVRLRLTDNNGFIFEKTFTINVVEVVNPDLGLRKALQSDGVDDEVVIPFSEDYNAGMSDEFTLVFRVKSDDWSSGRYIIRRDTGTIRVFQAQISSGRNPRMIMTNTGSSSDPTRLDYSTQASYKVKNDDWSSVAYRWDNGLLEIFIDGVNVPVSKGVDGGMTSMYTGSTLPIVMLGDFGSANYLDGGLKGVAIYDRALTDSEMDEVLTYDEPNLLTLNSSAPNLICYYPMENNTDNYVIDESGAHNGLKNNMPEDSEIIDYNFDEKSLNFGGALDYVNWQKPSILINLPSLPEFTIQIDHKVTATNITQQLIGNTDASNGYKGWAFGLNSNNTMFFRVTDTNSSNDLNVYSAAMSTSVNKYRNSFVCVDSLATGGVAMYEGINSYDTGSKTVTSKGASTVSNNLTGTDYVPDNDVIVGMRDKTDFAFGGNIKSITIWSKKFTKAECEELHDIDNVGKGNLNPYKHSQVANLIFYWKAGDNEAYPDVTDLVGSLMGTMIDMNASNVEVD